MVCRTQDVKKCRILITCDKCGTQEEFVGRYCFTEEEAFEKTLVIVKGAGWRASKDAFTSDLCPDCRNR